jgi:hypothetical protein
VPSRAIRCFIAFRMATNTLSACAVDASRVCRGRRMLREIPLTFRFGWARRYRIVVTWVDHPRWRVKRVREVAKYIAIVDGARPASRRM